MGEEILQPTPTPEIQLPPSNSKEDIYVPSSVEKKRALLMYFLLGIMTSLGDTKQQTVYERFHLRQAMGWWMIFMLILVVSVVLMFIPMVRYLPLFILLIMIIILGICIKQANDGKYGRDETKGLSLFAGIGQRILNLFEIKQENK